MTRRPRPRVQLTGGGPMWEQRWGKPAVIPPKPSKQERADKEELRVCLINLKESLRRRDLREARAMRRAAWEQVEKLPPHMSWQQRKALGTYKVLLRALEQQARDRRRS